MSLRGMFLLHGAFKQLTQLTENGPGIILLLVQKKPRRDTEQPEVVVLIF